jgi:hypothetical protein
MQGMGSMTGTSRRREEPWLQDYMGMFGGGGQFLHGALNAGSAFLGLLSDRNEKTDIKKLGKDEATGLDLYAYRYKDDPKILPEDRRPDGAGRGKEIPRLDRTRRRQALHQDRN